MKIAIIHNLPSGGAKVCLYKWIEFLGNKHTIDEYCFSSPDIGWYECIKEQKVQVGEKVKAFSRDITVCI